MQAAPLNNIQNILGVEIQPTGKNGAKALSPEAQGEFMDLLNEFNTGDGKVSPELLASLKEQGVDPEILKEIAGSPAEGASQDPNTIIQNVLDGSAQPQLPKVNEKAGRSIFSISDEAKTGKHIENVPEISERRSFFVNPNEAVLNPETNEAVAGELLKGQGTRIQTPRGELNQLLGEFTPQQRSEVTTGLKQVDGMESIFGKQNEVLPTDPLKMAEAKNLGKFQGNPLAQANMTNGQKSGLQNQLMSHDLFINNSEIPKGNLESKVANSMYSQFSGGSESLIKVKPHTKTESILGNSLNSDAAMFNADAAKLAQSEFIKPAAVGASVGKLGHTLDLSQIDASNTSEIIDQISKYIEQSSFQNRDQLKLSVIHESLGKFQINVNKMKSGDAIDIKILSENSRSQNFFASHEGQLIKSLGDNGVKVGGFKVVQSLDIARTEQNNNNFDGSRDHNGKGDNGQRQDQGQRHSQHRDSDRRRQLWEQMQERYSA